MLTPVEEQALRSRTTDLVLDWFQKARGSDEPAAPAAYVDLVVAASLVSDQAASCLGDWVAAARRAGLSWSDVGDALGMSRQGAQQRWGARLGDTSEEPTGVDQLIIRRGVTAFNEVGVLEEEGRAGREVVRAGWAKLYFRQTNRAWENCRIVSLAVRSRSAETLVAEGWDHVFSWYPYQYFKRPVIR